MPEKAVRSLLHSDPDWQLPNTVSSSDEGCPGRSIQKLQLVPLCFGCTQMQCALRGRMYTAVPKGTFRPARCRVCRRKQESLSTQLSHGGCNLTSTQIWPRNTGYACDNNRCVSQASCMVFNLAATTCESLCWSSFIVPSAPVCQEHTAPRCPEVRAEDMSCQLLGWASGGGHIRMGFMAAGGGQGRGCAAGSRRWETEHTFNTAFNFSTSPSTKPPPAPALPNPGWS